MLLKALRGSGADASTVPAVVPETAAITPPGTVVGIHALIDAGALAEAELNIAPLVQACPTDPDLQFLLGRLALMRNDSRTAAQNFENAVALRPELAAAHVELAKLYVSWCMPDRAQACYEAALKVVPNVAGLHNNLGLIHLEEKRLAAAEQCFQRAVQLDPKFTGARNNLGRVYGARKQYDIALEYFHAALAIDPANLHASINIGLALVEIGEHGKALAQLEACNHVAPGRTEILCGLGRSSFETERMLQARQYFHEALALDADCAAAHFGLANIALLQGELDEGWNSYEWRTRLPEFAQHYVAPQPRWEGQRLKGKTLLVNAEQGYGDILMFARFLPRITQPDTTVIFRCRPALVRLLQEITGLGQVVDTPAEEAVAADVSIPLLSIPRVLKIGLADLPGSIPYLRARPLPLETWRARLSADSRLRVGLAWGGNPLRRHQRGRTPPEEDYRALASITGVQFYNLQTDCSADDLARFPLPMIDPTPDIEDFADTAALVANLDLVISVDTSVAHLCGAMGRPTWLLHSGIPDWRWEIAGKESPWYPTVRVFRRRHGDWATVFSALADALHGLARS